MKQKTRYIFIDLLRGIALIFMIEAHVFNSTLSLAAKSTFWFHIAAYINGLVAPAFLFVSGFAFVISLSNKEDELRRFGESFWYKTGKIFLIWIVGYSLRLPYLSLHKMQTEASAEVLQRFFQIDVLQCIAAGLLLLLILKLIFKDPLHFHYSIIVLIFLIIISAPFFWESSFIKSLPLPAANYFTPVYGSLFPLFPWLGFLLSGAVFSKYFTDAKEKGTDKKFISAAALTGIVLAGMGFFLLSGIFPDWYRLIRPHPVFFFQRLGFILLFAGALWYYERNKGKGYFVLDVSRESLLIYWLHLQILFRYFFNGKSIAGIINNSFGFWEAFIAAVILVCLMVIAGKIWGKIKRNYPVFARYLTITIIIISFIIFIFF